MLNDYDGIKSKCPSLVNKIVQEKVCGGAGSFGDYGMKS